MKVMDESKGAQRACNGGGWHVDRGDNISFYRVCFIFHSFWPKASALLILFYFTLFYLFIVNTIDSQKIGGWWEINFSSKNNDGCVHRGGGGEMHGGGPRCVGGGP